MSAHPKRTARYFYREDFVLLDVVVDGAPVNIYYLGGARDSHHFHVFSTTWTPDFVPENDGRSLFSHGHDWLQSNNVGALI